MLGIELWDLFIIRFWKMAIQINTLDQFICHAFIMQITSMIKQPRYYRLVSYEVGLFDTEFWLPVVLSS